MFDTLALDRSQVKWENHLTKMMPWEKREGLFLKRGDFFAPLGYGGPNGFKLAQLIHLFARYRGNSTRVITGAASASPQNSMVALVAKHFGLPSHHVVGVKDVSKYPNLEIAHQCGATFTHVNPGYNPVIQAKVNALVEADPSSFKIDYGITTLDPRRVPAFHAVGARQMRNMPSEIETLYVPFGSGNTLCSVLLGLCQQPKNLRRVVSLGIGPNKVNFVKSRLQLMGAADLPFEWDHTHSLHDEGYATYADKFQETFAGIVMHPTYESKCIRYMRERGMMNFDVPTGFIIVGSAQDPVVIQNYF